MQPGGACTPCKGPAKRNCRYCDGDTKRCSECELGYFLDPKSKRCRAVSWRPRHASWRLHSAGGVAPSPHRPGRPLPLLVQLVLPPGSV